MNSKKIGLLMAVSMALGLPANAYSQDNSSEDIKYLSGGVNACENFIDFSFVNAKKYDDDIRLEFSLKRKPNLSKSDYEDCKNVWLVALDSSGAIYAQGGDQSYRKVVPAESRSLVTYVSPTKGYPLYFYVLSMSDNIRKDLNKKVNLYMRGSYQENGINAPSWKHDTHGFPSLSCVAGVDGTKDEFLRCSDSGLKIASEAIRFCSGQEALNSASDIGHTMIGTSCTEEE